jgi:hypothetical protein
VNDRAKSEFGETSAKADHDESVTKSWIAPIDRAVRKAHQRVQWRERLMAGASMIFRGGDRELWDSGAIIALYHRIAGDRESCQSPFAVRESEFAQQVQELGKRRTLVNVGELVARQRAGKPVSELAVISFDDGFACTVNRALPILRAAGVSATVFIDTARIDGPELSREQVRALSAGGVEIGSHTVNHVDVRRLSDVALMEELVESRRMLSEMIDGPVNGFAYPFGRFDDRAEKLVRQAGYGYACTCMQHRTNHADTDVYRLSRVEVNLGDTLPRFQKKIEGGFKGVYRMWYRLNPETRTWVLR